MIVRILWFDSLKGIGECYDMHGQIHLYKYYKT